MQVVALDRREVRGASSGFRRQGRRPRLSPSIDPRQRSRDLRFNVEAIFDGWVSKRFSSKKTTVAAYALQKLSQNGQERFGFGHTTKVCWMVGMPRSDDKYCTGRVAHLLLSRSPGNRWGASTDAVAGESTAVAVVVVEQTVQQVATLVII